MLFNIVRYKQHKLYIILTHSVYTIVYMNNLTNVSTTKFISEDTEKIADKISLGEKIYSIVKNKSDGVSAGEIAEILEITKNTVLKELRALEAERELYSNKVGNTFVWFPNGRLIHPYLEIFIELRGKPYRLSLQEGKSGTILQIQERSYSLLDGERVEGAIFLEYEALEELMKGIDEIKNRFSNYGKIEVKNEY